MSNIYGVGATQDVKNINLSGGSTFENINYDRPTTKVFYVDQPKNEGLTGGKKRKPQKRNIQRKKKLTGSNVMDNILDSPVYLDDNDFSSFLYKFFLYFRVSRSPPSAIYIIPSKEILKSMFDKADKLLEKEKAGKGTVKARQLINDSDIEFRRYLFVRYGDNDDKTDGYRIDPSGNSPDTSFPNGNFNTLRRTNLASEVYWISNPSGNKVIISSQKDSNKGNELKYVARSTNGCYIFRGDLPKVETIAENKNTAIRIGLKGGNVNNGNIQEYLDLCEQFNNADEASETFISKYYKNNKELFNKNMNGDLVNTAILSAFEDKIKGGNDEDELLDNILSFEKDSSNIVNNYNCVNKSNLKEKIDVYIDTLYNKCDKLTNSTVVNKLKKIYGNNTSTKVFKADLATALIRSNYDPKSAIMLSEMVDENDIDEKVPESYKYTILSAFKQYPATSCFGKEEIPIFSRKSNFNIKNDKHDAPIEIDEELIEEESEQKSDDESVTIEEFM